MTEPAPGAEAGGPAEDAPQSAPDSAPASAPESSPAQRSRLPGWAEAVVIGVVSRLLALTALFVGWKLAIPAPLGQHWSSPVVIWDAQWYLWVASQGYHAGPVAHTAFGNGYYDFAFFPLYPGLISALSLGGRLPLEIIAPVVSNVLFIFALIPIRIVLERITDRQMGRFGLLLFALSPAAYVYSLGYSEPLFLLLAGLFFATRGPVKGFLFAVLAALTRLGAAAIAVGSLPDLFDPKRRWHGVAGLAGVVLGFGAWWGWIANLTHDFFGYMKGSPAWYSNDSPTGSLTGLPSILAVHHPAVVFTLAVIAIVGVGSLVLLWRREYRYAFFSAACLASAYLVTWNTMPRLIVVAFPAFAAFAAVLPGDRVRWVMVGISALSMCTLGMLAVAGLVP